MSPTVRWPKTPPAWAIASMIITPGTTGFPGKCP